MNYFINNLKALEAEKETLKKRITELESVINKVKRIEDLKDLKFSDTKKLEIFKKRITELDSVIDKVKELIELGLSDSKIPITEEKVPIINKILKIIYKNESYLNWDKKELIVYESNYYTIYKIEDDLNLDIHQNSIFIGINIKNAFSKAVDY